LEPFVPFTAEDEAVLESLCGSISAEVTLWTTAPRIDAGADKGAAVVSVLVEVYREYNPEKIAFIPQILDAYDGRWETLFTALYGKYSIEGPIPRFDEHGNNRIADDAQADLVSSSEDSEGLHGLRDSEGYHSWLAARSGADAQIEEGSSSDDHSAAADAASAAAATHGAPPTATAMGANPLAHIPFARVPPPPSVINFAPPPKETRGSWLGGAGF
jgi:hypothetical protein